MDDLLKEAIADAKAVRETALENAKMALEEAFTPRLKSMLSQKIQNELEDEDGEEAMDDEEEAPEEGAYHEDDEDPSDADSEMDMEPEDEEPEEGLDMEGVIEINGVKYAPVIEQDEEGEEVAEIEDEEDEIEDEAYMKDADEDPSDEFSDEEPADDEEMDMEGVIEINGIKYAPVIEQDDEDEEEMGDEEEMEEEDLDLEAVIKELEAELDESEETEEVTEEEEIDEDKEEVDEQSDSSKIGQADNKVDAADAGDEEDPGKGKLKESKKEDVDEDIDLDEVLKAITEEEDEDEEMEEVAKLKSDLDEHRSVVETLRGKLNEVNLLNAKLLFTNKLFRKYGLNNEQKMKVVEQFDRAGTLREVKLVYSTLGESFGAARNEIKESKGAASKPVASTKSDKKVISEGTDLRDRFKKLANLI